MSAHPNDKDETYVEDTNLLFQYRLTIEQVLNDNGTQRMYEGTSLADFDNNQGPKIDVTVWGLPHADNCAVKAIIYKTPGGGFDYFKLIMKKGPGKGK